MFKKVHGWALDYEVGDAWRRVPVTVGGLVPNVRPIDSSHVLTDDNLKTLAKSMAEVMRRHGVS